MPLLVETLLDILSQLNSTSADIQASAIISKDGLVMAALLDNNVDEDRVAAMTTAVYAQANRILREIHLGKLRQVLVKAEQGYALVTATGEQTLLLTLFKKDASLGFVFLSCTRSAKKIAATGIVKPSPRNGLVSLSKSQKEDKEMRRWL